MLHTLLRFCQASRLQYLNGQVQLANQQVLQQQHVDHKIANALLRGTREDYKKWNLQDRAWVDMRLHESHDEGGFGFPNNTISRHAAAYTTNSRFVAFLGTFARPAQEVWLPGNDIQDPTTWRSLPFARSSTCTKLFCRTTTARSSRLQTSPHSHQMRAAARRQTPGRHLHLHPLATKTSVRAPLSFLS